MDPLSLLMGGAGLASNFFGQQSTNRMQAQMMQQQQSFQERMSSTAYQRASADMTAAGLNPMMMFSSGSAASTPAGASPSPNVKSGLDADAFQKAISTGVQARVANATIDNLVEQNAKIKAEAATERERPELVRADVGLTDQRNRNLKGDLLIKKYVLPVQQNEALRAENAMSMPASARRVLDIGAYGGRAVSQTLQPVFETVNSAGRWHKMNRWPDVDEETTTDVHKSRGHNRIEQYRSRRSR